jgi:hypothetical protein
MVRSEGAAHYAIVLCPASGRNKKTRLRTRAKNHFSPIFHPPRSTSGVLVEHRLGAIYSTCRLTQYPLNKAQTQIRESRLVPLHTYFISSTFHLLDTWVQARQHLPSRLQPAPRPPKAVASPRRTPRYTTTEHDWNELTRPWRRILFLRLRSRKVPWAGTASCPRRLRFA